MKVLFSFLLVAAFAGCGADEGRKDEAVAPASEQPKKAPITPTSFYVANAAAIPPCVAEHEGWLIYVAAEKALKACLGGQWAAVQLGDVAEPPATPTPGPSTPEPSGPDVTRIGLGTYVECDQSLNQCTAAIEANSSTGRLPDGHAFVVSIAEGSTAPSACDGSSQIEQTLMSLTISASSGLLLPGKSYSVRGCLFNESAGTYSAGVTATFTMPAGS